MQYRIVVMSILSVLLPITFTCAKSTGQILVSVCIDVQLSSYRNIPSLLRLGVCPGPRGYCSIMADASNSRTRQKKVDPMDCGGIYTFELICWISPYL